MRAGGRGESTFGVRFNGRIRENIRTGLVTFTINGVARMRLMIRIVMFVFDDYSTEGDENEKGPSRGQQPTAHFRRNARLKHFRKNESNPAPLKSV